MNETLETALHDGGTCVAAPAAAGAPRRESHRSLLRRRSEEGFTLIELIVVVTIIGILAAAAMVNVRFAIRKARESALKDNLFQMRKAIDNYYADKQHYPATLEELVPNYIRKIPADPVTQKVDWEVVMEDPMSLEGDSNTAIPSQTDPQAMSQPGVTDVKSKAPGKTLDDIPYSEL